MKGHKLTDKQRVFVAEYLKDKNATRSAKAAGYSKKTADKIGAILLGKSWVRAAVDAGLARLVKKAELKAEDVINELRSIAFIKMKDAYALDGTLLNPHDMPEDVQAALAGLEMDEIFVGRGASRHKIGETKKVKMHDKVKCLEILGKHLNLFTDGASVSVSNEVSINVTQEQLDASAEKARLKVK